MNFLMQLGKMLQNEPSGLPDVEITYLKALHVNWNRVTTEDLPKMWASPSERENYAVQNGDLLVCEGGEVGRAAIIRCLEEPAIIQNALHRLRGNSRGDVRYFSYLLRHIADAGWFAVLCNKATIAHLTGEKLGAIYMPVPTVTEQQKIAAFLDWKTAQIDALIAKKQELIAKLKEKRLAVITQAVTKGLDPTAPMCDSGIPRLGEVPKHWAVLQIGRMITLQRGVDITKDEQEDGDVPVISSGGIASYHNVVLVKGPGVIVGRKGTAGALYYIDADYWPHDTTLYVREYWSNHPRYVYYKLLSMDLASYDTGTANPTVNRNRVHPEIVSWPPLDEQFEIARYLDSASKNIDCMISKGTEAIAHLTEYRSALITAATTGKIDLRGWQAEKEAA